MLRLSRQLFLRRVALSQRHRDKLPNQAFLDAETVKPRLVRNHQIVLRCVGEFVLPCRSGYRVDFARRYLDSHRIVSVEINPHRFRLIHR